MRIIRKIHRYIALVLGLALLAWIGSGMMMMLSEPTPDAMGQPVRYTHDYSAVVLSPAEAIGRLRDRHGAGIEVASVTVRPLMDRLVYEIGLRDQPNVLLDAGTAEPIQITPELAEQIAGVYLKKDVGRASIDRVDQHYMTYPWGPLPVYRLEFENGRGTIAYVSLEDGKVRFTDWQRQTWHFLTSFHEFGPLRILFGSEAAARWALWIAAVLSLVILATGYTLEITTLTRRRRKRAPNV